MISRSTLVGALVVLELAILGVAAKAVAGGGTAPSAGASLYKPGFTTGWTGGAPQSGYDHTFTTGRTPHVVVDVNDVQVTVQTADVSSVHVAERVHREGLITGDVPPVTAAATADGVRVTTARNADVLLIGDFDHEVRLTVPPGAQVEIASGGTVHAAGLRGKLTARIANGWIHVDDHRGDLDLKAVHGRIYLTDVQGDAIHADSDYGRLVFRRVGADHIEAHTADGRIEAMDLRAVDGAMSTNDGPVNVSFTRSSDATVDAHTSDGHVRVRGLNASQADDRTTVVLGTGRGRFALSSSDGSLNLTQGASI